MTNEPLNNESLNIESKSAPLPQNVPQDESAKQPPANNAARQPANNSYQPPVKSSVSNIPSQNQAPNGVIPINTVMDYYNYPPQAPFFKPKKITPVYTTLEKVFAFLFIALGYIFIKFVLMGNMSLSATLFCVFTIIFTVIFLKKEQKQIPVAHVFSFVIIFIFSLNFFINDNTFIKFLNFIFIVFSGLFLIYTSGSNNAVSEKNFILSVLKSVFLGPFISFGDCPMAVVQSVRSPQQSQKKVSQILIGLAIAVPVLVIIIPLLISSDEMFRRIFSLDMIIGEVFLFTFQLAVGLPVAFYIYSSIYSQISGKNSAFNEEKRDESAQTIQKMPPLIAQSALMPVLITYVLYIFSQMAYFFSAFKSLLPEGFTFSDYARKGFFELCAISLINLAMIVAVYLFVKRKGGLMKLSVRIYISVLSLFTLVLLTTAVSKMLLYITECGLTRLRIYTLWFMFLLALIFILIIFKQFFLKLRFYKICLICFVLMFGILCFSNVDGVIAKYNIEQYEQGITSKFDYDLLDTLDSGSVFYLADVLNNKETKLDTNIIRDTLEHQLSRIDNQDNDFNLQHFFAKRFIRQIL